MFCSFAYKYRKQCLTHRQYRQRVYHITSWMATDKQAVGSWLWCVQSPGDPGDGPHLWGLPSHDLCGGADSAHGGRPRGVHQDQQEAGVSLQQQQQQRITAHLLTVAAIHDRCRWSRQTCQSISIPFIFGDIYWIKPTSKAFQLSEKCFNIAVTIKTTPPLLIRECLVARQVETGPSVVLAAISPQFVHHCWQSTCAHF